MNSDLQVSREHLEIIKSLLTEHVPGYKVIAFGSRATGKSKPHSDLDLAIVCDEPVDPKVLAKLRVAFEESDLPYKVDIVEYVSVSETFKRIIDSMNIELMEDQATEDLEL